MRPPASPANAAEMDSQENSASRWRGAPFPESAAPLAVPVKSRLATSLPADYAAPAAVIAAAFTSPSTVGQEQAEPSGDDAGEEEAERRSWAAVMLAVPSWLVSFVFHLAVLLAAAMLSFSVDDKTIQRILVAEALEEDEEAMEEIIFETDPDLEQIEISAIPAESDPRRD